MKSMVKRTLTAAAAGTLLKGLPASVALAQPMVGVGINGDALGDILMVEVVGMKGPLAVNALNNQLPLPASIDLAVGLGSLPATGMPLDGLADMIPSDALPAIPADPIGAVTSLIRAGGGAPSLPGLPALPIDVVGTVTGLIPAGGAPSLPAPLVDVVATVTGLVSGGVPALPVDPVATLTGLLPVDALPLP